MKQREVANEIPKLRVKSEAKENAKQNTKLKVREMTETAMFAALLAVLGMLKLPSVIPGCEFQLSAPFIIHILCV